MSSRLARLSRTATTIFDASGLRSAGWKWGWIPPQHEARRPDEILYGLCELSTRTILFERLHVLADPWEEVHDTILHEVAHALTGHHRHDRQWRAIALRLRGAHPASCPRKSPASTSAPSPSGGGRRIQTGTASASASARRRASA